MSLSPTSPAAPCIIYCRVSSLKQMREGDGLKGQEKRCRDYAAIQGYKVLRVFYEEGISGGSDERPAMKQMLEFLDGQTDETIVVVDDLKRFARDVALHFDLKVSIYQRGGRLESPSFRFGSTAEDRFIETVLAAQAELERNQNKRQVVNRMKARLEQGYWTFNPPAGYSYRAHPVHKKILTLDATKAPAIKEALEGFAADRFRSLAEVQRFLMSSGYFGAAPDPFSTRYLMHVARLLSQVLYTGHLEYKPWDIPLRPAQHPAIISLATYQQIQEKLAGRRAAKFGTTARSDTREDFPLRNYTTCTACRRLLTASWSRGRHARYPYYHCPNKACTLYGKAIRKTKIEEEYLALMNDLEMDDAIKESIRSVATDFWQSKAARFETAARNREKEQARQLEEIGQNLKGLAEKLARTNSEVVAQTLEASIEAADRQRLLLLEELNQPTTPRVEFGTAFEKVEKLLQNPRLTWEEGDLQWRRLVQRLVFTTPMSYDRNSGFGTRDLSLPYQISRRVIADQSSLVDIPFDTWNLYLQALFNWALLVETMEVNM